MIAFGLKKLYGTKTCTYHVTSHLMVDCHLKLDHTKLAIDKTSYVCKNKPPFKLTLC